MLATRGCSQPAQESPVDASHPWMLTACPGVRGIFMLGTKVWARLRAAKIGSVGRASLSSSSFSTRLEPNSSRASMLRGVEEAALASSSSCMEALQVR